MRHIFSKTRNFTFKCLFILTLAYDVSDPPTYSDAMANNSRTVHGQLRGPDTNVAVDASSGQEQTRTNGTTLESRSLNSQQHQSRSRRSKSNGNEPQPGLQVDLGSARSKSSKSKKSEKASSSSSLSSTPSRGAISKVGRLSVTRCVCSGIVFVSKYRDKYY